VNWFGMVRYAESAGSQAMKDDRRPWTAVVKASNEVRSRGPQKATLGDFVLPNVNNRYAALGIDSVGDSKVVEPHVSYYTYNDHGISEASGFRSSGAPSTINDFKSCTNHSFGAVGNVIETGTGKVRVSHAYQSLSNDDFPLLRSTTIPPPPAPMEARTSRRRDAVQKAPQRLLGQSCQCGCEPVGATLSGLPSTKDCLPPAVAAVGSTEPWESVLMRSHPKPYPCRQ
jgi:hypothetical protein